jgi:NitT/TauT family transport system ATP-binding protein
VICGNAPLIVIERVRKLFRSRSGESQEALADISLEVERKQFVCIVGPSGCGKSTLLRLIAGLLQPSSGKIRIAGDQVRGPRRDIGFVFQSPVLLPWRNVRDNVLVPAEVLRFDRREAARRAAALLDLVGLADFADHFPAELSGGMRQRVAIARSLMHDPEILLMDEPFGALDALTRETMNIELLRIWQASGKTVILVTHSIEEALLLSDRVAVMTERPGRILEELRVPLPRPRSSATRAEAEFVRLAASLRSYFQPAGTAQKRSRPHGSPT